MQSQIFRYWIINLFYLIFIVAPSIVRFAFDETAIEGTTAFLSCLAMGRPFPTFRWYFNGAPLEMNNTNKYRVDISLNFSILAIFNVESSDVGTYTCNATNVISSDTISGILTVNGKFHWSLG